MAFFDDLGKKITQAGQAVSQKTKDFTGVAKLNAAISDEEKKLQHVYSQIGRLYVSKYGNNADPDFVGLISTTKEAEKNIINYRQQIQNIKGLVRCEKCGAEIPNNVLFCNACGASVAPSNAYAPTNQPVNPNLVQCTGCGQMVSKDLKFCTACGAPTAPAPAPAAPAPAPVPTAIPTPTEAPAIPTPVETAAKKCSNCGSEIPDGMAFCQECGTKVQ